MKKMATVLDHPELPEVRIVTEEAVTSVILENQESAS